MAVKEIIEIRTDRKQILDIWEYFKGLRDKKYPDLTDEKRAQSDQDLLERAKKASKNLAIKKAKGLE